MESFRGTRAPTPGKMRFFNMTEFNLCREAEPRLKQAVRDRAIIIVNGLIVVKMRGRLAGYSIGQAEGILPGYWMTPGAPSVRTAIREAFIAGQSHITFPDQTFWTYLGGVRLTIEEDKEIRKIASTLSPKTMMQGKEKRRAYVAANKELFLTERE